MAGTSIEDSLDDKVHENQHPPKKVYHPMGADRSTISKPKRKPKILKGIVLLIVAGLLIMAIFIPLEGYLPHLWGGPFYPESARFTVQRTISLSTAGRLDYNVTIPYPEDIIQNDIQFIHDISWNVEPKTFENSTTGVIWKAWESSIEADSEEIIVTYDVETSTVIWDYNRGNSGTLDQVDPDIRERYSGDRWEVTDLSSNERLDRNGDGRYDVMIEPSHPEIKSLAEDITREEDTIYGKAQEIYDWMQRNIDYKRGATGELPKHAVWTLDSQSGDCDEWAFLFISMARAVGIPAWIELGVIYDQGRDVWGGHGWVRMNHVSEEGESDWVNIDLTFRQFFARDPLRITTWVDDGLEGSIEDYYNYVSYQFTDHDPSINEEYSNIRMDTEGSVYIGDRDIPWSGVLLAPALFIAIFFHKKKIVDTKL